LKVTVFPEATSTNGESVLRFRRPLYQAAVQSGCPIQPICINYRAINGFPVRKENRDDVCWYGSMDFFSHFINLLTVKCVEVDIHFLEPICSQKENDANR